jgi:hypothetical protein
VNETTSKELQGLKNFAEQTSRPQSPRDGRCTATTDHRYATRDRRRLSMLRRTGKPHIYLENGEWLILEKTAPGEWWLSPL